MKQRIKAILAAACLAAPFVSGCSEKQQEDAEEPELISFVEENKQLNSSLSETLEGYFSALENHDYDSLIKYTDEDFIWNRDETAFEEYCRHLADCAFVSADFELMTVEDDVYCLPVSYTAVFDAPFVDENGEQQKAGTYEYDCRFTLAEREGDYIITTISDQPVG